MNKRGFTILELVTVIALLSIVGIVLIPKISTVFNTSKADQLGEIRNDILLATDIYLNDSCGKSDYNDIISNKSKVIYLKDIMRCGLIDEKIYNSNSNTYFEIKDQYITATVDDNNVINYETSF